MNVGQAAFLTSTALAAVTIGSAVLASSATAKVALVAYAALGITAGGASIASITAYIDDSSKDVESYFKNFQKHAGYAIAGTYQFVAQTLVQNLIAGIGSAVRDGVYKAIMGDQRSQKS